MPYAKYSSTVAAAVHRPRLSTDRMFAKAVRRYRSTTRHPEGLHVDHIGMPEAAGAAVLGLVAFM